MEWLLILGLLGWATLLTFRTGALKERAETLERRLTDLARRLDETSPPPADVEAVTRSRKAATETAHALAKALAPGPATTPVASPAPPVRPPPRPTGPPPREIIRRWLEENGLAWAGGGALALGGLFLVTYAAQRGVFTPPFRIAGAVLLGALLLEVSEWLKRRSGHPLAAALAAGAGAATLYGAAWASYWLYAFISLGASAGLMAVISAGLLALAFRHGEPLAILAILGGFLAPAVTGPEQWSAPALTGYLALLGRTGYAVAGVRGWGWAGAATLTGAAGWALAGYAAGDPARVVLLAVAPVALAAAAVTWRRRTPANDADASAAAFELMPAAALALGAVLVAAGWLGRQNPDWIPAAGAGAVALALLAALLDRRALIPGTIQVFGYAPALASLFHGRPLPAEAGRLEIWVGVTIAALAAAGVHCRHRSS